MLFNINQTLNIIRNSMKMYSTQETTNDNYISDNIINDNSRNNNNIPVKNV